MNNNVMDLSVCSPSCDNKASSSQVTTPLPQDNKTKQSKHACVRKGPLQETLLVQNKYDALASLAGD